MLKDERSFAVIDTETNWDDQIMSIGVTISGHDFQPVESRYYIVTPECLRPGMYSSVLRKNGVAVHMEDERSQVMDDIHALLKKHDCRSVFAYNARFDMNHLPELSAYRWYDIIRIAAYRQYNKTIPENADCCGTGRLKRNYGVEPIMRGLSGKRTYREVHNALCDAVDELLIMKFLGHSIETYECALINGKQVK